MKKPIKHKSLKVRLKVHSDLTREAKRRGVMIIHAIEQAVKLWIDGAKR